MAKGNFKTCLAVTLSHEGGWSDHPKDPGGATMKGITLARYRQHKPSATKADLRKITDAEVEYIYRADYWVAVKGEDLPYGVDLAVFDFGVNSGPARSKKYLQAVLGVAQDGIIGTQTLAAVKAADPVQVVKKLCARRLAFVRGLSTFSVFGKGWTRRIADVEAKAVAMALAKGKAKTEEVRERLEVEAIEAKERASSQTGGAGAAGGIGGIGLITDVNWVTVVVLLVLLAGAGYLIWRSRVNRERSAAYEREAAA